MIFNAIESVYMCVHDDDSNRSNKFAFDGKIHSFWWVLLDFIYVAEIPKRV